MNMIRDVIACSPSASNFLDATISHERKVYKYGPATRKKIENTFYRVRIVLSRAGSRFIASPRQLYFEENAIGR